MPRPAAPFPFVSSREGNLIFEEQMSVSQWLAELGIVATRIPENSHMVPSILCILGQGSWWHIKSKLNHLKKLLSVGSQVGHKVHHVALHDLVRPRTRAVTGPLREHPVIFWLQVFTDGEDFRMVCDSGSDLLSRGDVSAKARVIDTSVFLRSCFLEELFAGFTGLAEQAFLSW